MEDIMEIIDDFYVGNDKYNWILMKKHIVTEDEASKRKNAKVGDIEYKHISYHNSLENVLRKLFEMYKKKKSKRN